MSGDRLQSVQEALRNVREQAAALEELSEQLSLSVHLLETEVAALDGELRAARQEAAQAPAPDPPAALAALSTDVDGARLVALNMALNGDSRETTARYLAEHFEIAEPERMLDEVYAAIEP